jgi:copper(I)-binding protein
MKKRKVIMAKILIALAYFFYAANSFAHIEVSDAYVRGLPPGQPNTAAFMAVLNDTTDDITLVRVNSPAAEVVEMHRHSHVNGVMQMRQVKAIDIESGEQFMFSPGGYHIMLIGLRRPLSHGENVELELVFSSGAKVMLTTIVRSVLKENN